MCTLRVLRAVLPFLVTLAACDEELPFAPVPAPSAEVMRNGVTYTASNSLWPNNPRVVVVTVAATNRGDSPVADSIRGGNCMLLVRLHDEPTRTAPPIRNESEMFACQDIGPHVVQLGPGESEEFSTFRTISELLQPSFPSAEYYFTAVVDAFPPREFGVAAGERFLGRLEDEP